ncbi:bromodomain-containing protein DDB_G0280777 [Drosophila montana]|uniref:bromodomain-containing protein DDB_G0280777 n=1 Tax=Drosophila montana TaxID=40370 RepID=UPI00313D70F3
MHLLLLSLLALGAHAHSIGYRNNLLSYAPARGEFPVQSQLAQGYMRYLDNTGAERLVAFNYPEPLYGIRSIDQQVKAQDQLEQQQQHLALFRAWCEQRYNALRAELERLRAEGKQPSANMLAQYEPLEQIIKTNAFDAVPGLNPEVQRARDEHLRIWNEARLQVLQAESAVPQASQDAVIQLKSMIPLPVAASWEKQPQIKQISNNAEPQNSPQPVQETAEVQRAREEHLKRYNEALQQQQQQQQPAEQQIQEQLVKSRPVQPIEQQQQQQAPQPVEETPEVKRAREEHLKQYNEVILRQAAEAQAQPQQESIAAPYEPQAAVKAAIPLSAGYVQSIKAHEQQIQQLSLTKLKAEDKVADISDKIRYEERDRDAERELEQERREELRLLELERQRELQRLMEEQRLLDAERLALQQQEQQRIESERLEESQRLQAERLELQQQLKITSAPAQPQPAQPQHIAQQQQVQNGFFLRIQSGQPSQPISPSVPIAEPYLLAEHAHNPFLVRYVQQPQALVKTISNSQLSANSISSSASASSSTSSTSTKSSSSLSELEQATREHFKAHEIALEQLRLANQKNPNLIPCTH